MTPEALPPAPAMPAQPLPQAADIQARPPLAAAPVQTRAYPWLLLASTSVSAIFCFMYITKPVFPVTPSLTIKPVAAQPRLTPDQPATQPATQPALSLLPSARQLPGDTQAPRPAANPPQRDNPHRDLPASPVASAFEETNLHIQHILTAETPDGDLSRIVLNVPVLYQTRTLGWTHDAVAESRELLKRLDTYQENTRILREEGIKLLAAWNRLVERSIPTSSLRADSPSLPANQTGVHSTQKPAGLDTAESIQIQPADP